jgi:Protein of unknown function (DUF3168)
MPPLIESRPGLAVEAQDLPEPALISIRKAVRTALRADPYVMAKVGGRVFYRPRRALSEFPCITFFDFVSRPDQTVPLFDGTMQVDCWAAESQLTTELADRVVQVLAPRRLALPPRVGLRLFGLVANRDEVTDDATISRRLLEFRLLYYDRLVIP